MRSGPTKKEEGEEEKRRQEWTQISIDHLLVHWDTNGLWLLGGLVRTSAKMNCIASAPLPMAYTSCLAKKKKAAARFGTGLSG